MAEENEMSTIKQKNTTDLGMEHENKNQGHQEKYFLGIFHALHHLATKSAENRNSYCDAIHKLF